jgi:glucan biosynthesis protein C
MIAARPRTAAVAVAAGRLHWIDALKALVIVGIAVFHASLVFSGSPWVVNNSQSSLILMGFGGFTFQWGIALMFVLAGGATWFGLRRRGVVRFARERITRLGLPLVLGVALLSPLQWYVEHTRSIQLGDLLRSYVTFWGSVHVSWSPASAYGLVFHLWFLTHLLAISLLTLPVAWWLKGPAGRRLAGRLVSIAGAPLGLFAFAIPLALVQMALHARYPAYQDWSDLASWAVLYLTGYVLVSDGRFTKVLAVRGAGALVVGIGVWLGIGLLYLGGYVPAWDAHPDYSPGYLGYQALRSLNTWAWVVYWLHFGVRFFSGPGRIAEWGVEMPMPFYVLHHPVLVVIARYVVAWDVILWAKFAVITLSAITITLVLCEGVRRSRIPRAIFGLRGSAATAPQGART